jgi:hypothetical protein
MLIGKTKEFIMNAKVKKNGGTTKTSDNIDYKKIIAKYKPIVSENIKLCDKLGEVTHWIENKDGVLCPYRRGVDGKLHIDYNWRNDEWGWDPSESDKYILKTSKKGN